MRNQRAGKSTLTTIAVLFGFASLALVATYRPANACGGLFCNARPPDPFAPLPVAQNGENVVFSITKDPAGGAPTLQAHIQILYTGEAAKFSWVVPVDAAPELSTGTDRLFSQLANVTAPKFTTSPVIDGNCIPQPNTTGAAGAFGGGTAGTTGSAGSTGAGGSGVAGVMVNFQGAVGPFDAAVIKSDDATALKAWLTDNGYIISDQASGLIDVYVRENKFFVALKLLNGVGVRSIQPIVLTFRGTEACVPLRLTAIAANPDMPVLVWVLSDKRVAPRGYYEMTIDEASINWLQSGTNYFGSTGLVSKAANEAGGNAFVTEYAGPSTVAQRSVYVNGTINLTTLMMSMTPPTYVQQLISMGLTSDPLMLPLLQKYIPMPDALKTMGSTSCGGGGTGGTGGGGVTPSQFYGNINCYWQNYAFPAYDLAGLTQAISDSIVTPRVNAQMMIDGHPYLTRLNTFISPEEMTKDPFFFESRDLGNISNVHTAVLRTMCGAAEYMACNAPQRIELADGRTFWVRAGSKATTCQGATPTVLSNLPAAEVAFERAETGEGTRVLDNRAAIAAGIAASNAAFPNEQMRFPIPSGTGGSTGVAGTGGGDQGTGGAGGAGSGSGGMGGTTSTPVGSGGVSGPVGTGGAYPADNVGSVSGCSCTTGGDAGSGAVILALAGLFSVRRRGRSR